MTSKCDVLLRFRRHPAALICDIAEMYLRIEVATKDRSCQMVVQFTPGSKGDTNRGQSIRGGHQQGSRTNSKDTGNHVASRRRRVHVQSKSTRVKLSAH